MPMWRYHVRRRSKWTPTYLNWFSKGTSILFIFICAQFCLLSADIPWVHLNGFTLILHLSNRFSKSNICDCNCVDATFGSLLTLINAVSSAYIDVYVLGSVGMSDVYIKYRIGPSMLSWGIPAEIIFVVESSSFNLISGIKLD